MGFSFGGDCQRGHRDFGIKRSGRIYPFVAVTDCYRWLCYSLLLSFPHPEDYSGRGCLCHLVRCRHCLDLPDCLVVFRTETGCGGGHRNPADCCRGCGLECLFQNSITVTKGFKLSGSADPRRPCQSERTWPLSLMMVKSDLPD